MKIEYNGVAVDSVTADMLADKKGLISYYFSVETTPAPVPAFYLIGEIYPSHVVPYPPCDAMHPWWGKCKSTGALITHAGKKYCQNYLGLEFPAHAVIYYSYPF